MEEGHWTESLMDGSALKRMRQDVRRRVMEDLARTREYDFAKPGKDSKPGSLAELEDALTALSTTRMSDAYSAQKLVEDKPPRIISATSSAAKFREQMSQLL
eukprot:TRINITY_DN21917_c0_g1_i1.p2 TRINITY_DN21917_c0_g1~~TRINITY_DN21917_c0_g1_i1.p2  ORF type:complete len:102 (+),score=24.52 TRINITY_DN21917_c0_g1_i1:28-333(+)